MHTEAEATAHHQDQAERIIRASRLSTNEVLERVVADVEGTIAMFVDGWFGAPVPRSAFRVVLATMVQTAVAHTKTAIDDVESRWVDERKRLADLTGEGGHRRLQERMGDTVSFPQYTSVCDVVRGRVEDLTEEVDRLFGKLERLEGVRFTAA